MKLTPTLKYSNCFYYECVNIFCKDYPIDFINVLRAAFAHPDPESVKKTVKLKVLFTILGSAHSKAARRTLMKLTQGVSLTSILRTPFLNESVFANFLLLQFVLVSKRKSRKKLLIKCW